MNLSMGMMGDSEQATALPPANSANPGSLTTLPDELLLLILSHLDDVSSISLGLVSTRIYSVVKSLFPHPIPLEDNIGNVHNLRTVVQSWLGPQYRLAFLRCRYAYFDFEQCTFLKKDVYGNLQNQAYKMEQDLQERYSEYHFSLVLTAYGERKFGSLPSPCGMGEAWYEAAVTAIGNDLLKRDTSPDEDSSGILVIFGNGNNAFLQAYKQYLDLLLQDDNLWEMEDFQTRPQPYLQFHNLNEKRDSRAFNMLTHKWIAAELSFMHAASEWAKYWSEFSTFLTSKPHFQQLYKQYIDHRLSRAISRLSGHRGARAQQSLTLPKPNPTGNEIWFKEAAALIEADLEYCQNALVWAEYWERFAVFRDNREHFLQVVCGFAVGVFLDWAKGNRMKMVEEVLKGEGGDEVVKRARKRRYFEG